MLSWGVFRLLQWPLRSVPMVTLLVVLFVTAIIQSVFGFGQALLAVPLLIALYPLPVLVPLLALVSLTISLAVVRYSSSAIDRRLLMLLATSAAIGVPCGVWLVVRIDASQVRTSLGLLLMLYCLLSVLPLRPRPLPRSDVIAGFFGLSAGILGGALNLMGPPVVVLMQLQRLDPPTFRATLHAFSIFVNSVVVAVWFVADDTPVQVLQLYALCVIPVIIATILGHRLFDGIDARRYQSVVYLLIGLAGLRLLITSA